MTETVIDSDAFRAYELAGWQQSVEAYHEHIGSLTSQTIEPLLDAVRADDHAALLDMATGPGYVAAAAHRRGARVIAVDFSESMIVKARQLHPAIDFRIDDVEALSFGEGQFDVAVMNFGILHLARPPLALREACRVLKPLGRFGFTAWAKPEEAAGFGIVLKAIEKHGRDTAALPQGPPFFLFSNRAECVGALHEAGFIDPKVLQLPLTWTLKSSDDLFNAFYKGTARTGGLLRAQPIAALEAIREEIRETAEIFRRDGFLQIPMAVVIAWAVKPHGGADRIA